MSKTVYVEDLMQGLKQDVENHPDPEYRKLLLMLMGSERGRDMLSNLVMCLADKHGVEIKEKPAQEPTR